MILVKGGVVLDQLHPQLLRAIDVSYSVFKAGGDATLTVTSVRDGKHMPGSLHYQGRAVDLRLPDPPEKAGAMVLTIRQLLCDCFDVILERTHIHIEYDPK